MSWLQIHQLPEIVVDADAPHILSEVDAALKEEQMKSHLDEYLSVRIYIWWFFSVFPFCAISQTFSLFLLASCSFQTSVYIIAWFLQMRQHNSSFLYALKQRLLLPASEAEADSAGARYNVPLVNSLVLYVGLHVSYLRWTCIWFLWRVFLYPMVSSFTGCSTGRVRRD